MPQSPLFRAALAVAVVAAMPAVARAAPSPAGPATTDPRACLTTAIYHEAAREPDAGQDAVAAVILNRMAHPAYPKSLCAVVFEGHARVTGCQFSFTCDGALGRRPNATLWARADAAAARALDAPPTLSATHYHADYVRPYWASSLSHVATIGRHIFYTLGVQRSAPALIALAGPATPSATTFSAWGLPIATLSPSADGVIVKPAR